MTARLDAVREADVVVLGAGAAGLSVALGLGGRRVDLLAKGPLGRTGNSPWAQGGIAGAVGPGDSPSLHAADTLAVAGELGDSTAVARLTSEGPERLAQLLALGARFDRDGSGQLDLAREAAHSRARVLHARDATGAEVVRAMGVALVVQSGLSVFESALAVDLVLDGGRAAGVLARHADGALVLHRARAVVLATGGIGRVFARTTNPPEATGDGLALAWRAGARLVDLEFVQFHPTALDVGADPMPLLTEALRGAGATLVDEEGRRLLVDAGPQAELLPRDVVARALWSALASGRRALLDAREAVGESFPERFPTVFESCRRHGLDPRLEPIPVAPAAHYHMGGVDVDLDGRTSVPGLWAAGEVACTGVHGANRLASNSLLEALVFGARVAGEPRRGAAAPAAAGRHAGAAVHRAVARARRGGGRGSWDPAADVGEGRPRTHRRRPAGRAPADRGAEPGDSGRRGGDPQPRHGGPPGGDRGAGARREPRRPLPGRPPPCRPRLASSYPPDAGGAGGAARDRARPGPGRRDTGDLRVTETTTILPLLYEDVVRRALVEDLGRAGDITTDAIVPPGLAGRAAVVARAAGRVAGLEPALHAFRLLDPECRIDVRLRDGSDAGNGDAIARVTAAARALLTAERTALNLLGHLSGIATATRDVVARLEGLKTRVVGTRKTTPGLRALEKYAVRVGGGSSHRYGLDDAVLVKDNHVALAGGVAEAVLRVRRSVGHMVKVEVEVDTLAQLDDALAIGVDAVLLDNMDVTTLREAVRRSRGRAVTEASGGIRPENVREVAETGVDLISLGWLTHSAPALDVALDLEA